MRPLLLLIGAIVVSYVYSWERDSHPGPILFGLASTTALNALFFGVYVFTVEEQATHTGILMMVVLFGPAFDVLRKMYPNQGVFAGMVAMFTFIVSEKVPVSFTATGLVLAVLPATVASIDNYHTALRIARQPPIVT